jgi:EAL domain-containing protein (putative c-di-GMP-specific phosphodiesterase class I)
MVHSINVRICAEGIEKKEWSLKMKEMQVDYLQGYYYGRPCEKEQFIQRYKCS